MQKPSPIPRDVPIVFEDRYKTRVTISAEVVFQWSPSASPRILRIEDSFGRDLTREISRTEAEGLSRECGEYYAAKLRAIAEQLESVTKEIGHG